MASPDVPTPWVVAGYAARGEVTVLSGPPKVGKTTLMAHCCAAVVKGHPFLNRQTEQQPVFWLNLEQHPRRMKKLLRSLGAGGRPFFGADEQLDDLRQALLERGIGLLVIDSLSRFWRITDENDAIQATAAVKILRDLALQTDAAVVAIHHDRKSGGEDGMNIRGSGALLAAVDHAVSVKRQLGHPNRRVLELVSRESEAAPRRLVIELVEGHYHALGAQRDVTDRDAEQAVLRVMGDEPKTYNELSEITGESRATVKRVAKRLADRDQIQRSGEGKRNDPLRFASNDTSESNSVSAQVNSKTETETGVQMAHGPSRVDSK